MKNVQVALMISALCAFLPLTSVTPASADPLRNYSRAWEAAHVTPRMIDAINIIVAEHSKMMRLRHHVRH